MHAKHNKRLFTQREDIFHCRRRIDAGPAGSGYTHAVCLCVHIQQRRHKHTRFFSHVNLNLQPKNISPFGTEIGQTGAEYATSTSTSFPQRMQQAYVCFRRRVHQLLFASVQPPCLSLLPARCSCDPKGVHTCRRLQQHLCVHSSHALSPQHQTHRGQQQDA